MSCRELQKACKQLGMPSGEKAEVLRKNLADYAVDPEGTLKNIHQLKMSKPERTRKDGWVNWKSHAAREILMEDLEPGGWLHGKDDEDAKCVCGVYQSRQDEFKHILFEQFEVRYNEAIKKAAKRRARSAEEEEFLKHDRLLHPRQSHNHRGEPVFDMDIEAKEQLQDDIKQKLHKELTPMELWELRPAYQKYKLDKFRPRIYQAIRKQKFINWLEKKRTEKRDEYAGPSVTFVRQS